MVVDLSNKQLNQMLSGTCKLVTKDYIIYKREWLEDNLDNEIKLIKDHAERRKKGIKPFNKEDLDKYLSEKYQQRMKGENDES